MTDKYQMKLQVSLGLKDKLKAAAADNARPVNREVELRLERSFWHEQEMKTIQRQLDIIMEKLDAQKI